MPTVCAYENDVGDATGSSVLKRVVEDDDVASLPLRLLDTNEPIGRDDYRDVGIESPVDERFVFPVAA